ncbi:MAG: SAM-dependent methyltransferase [Proteobacteria bacterium]|nr:SAM-dependent methyltransferase [Pseudomonadota bacterium]
MSTDNSHSKFANLSFDDFRKLASDPTLSRHEKVGFPDSYRQGKEGEIFRDMCGKISNLSLPGKNVMEIGPGCSELPVMLAKRCETNASRLIFVDSEEMLELLPLAGHITRYAGTFPSALGEDIEEWAGKIDVIIAYSVVQYVFTEGNLWGFVDRCLSLLSDGGEIMFGDVPNITMRKRFFSSAAGKVSHRQYTGRDEKPEVLFNQLEPGQMDDSVVLAILARVRAQGFHAWVVPQLATLPMANRREDILIVKP